jgi:hypothetical protein
VHQYILTADLGQLSDYTALSLLKETTTKIATPTLHDIAVGSDGRIKVERMYHLIYLHRFELRTPYPDMVDHIAKMVRGPNLSQNVDLVVDATGVGRPVIDMMRRENLRPIPITITGGKEVVADELDGGYHVPKRDIASSTNILFGTRRIKIVPGMALTDTYIREMANFTIKIKNETSASYEAWREADHDDLVLSVGMAAWWVLFSRSQQLHYNPIDKEPEERYDPRAYLTNTN